MTTATRFRLVFNVPTLSLAQCKEAIFAAGAGRYPGPGNYTDCCWTVVGTGQFRPGDAAKPHLGEVGKLEEVEEARVETICVGEDVARNAVKALKSAHPYEEPSYSVSYGVQPQIWSTKYGTGRLGPPTVKHLLKNGFKVSVLTRSPSSGKLPPEVDVIAADYTSAETLTPSLVGRGFDAIVIDLNRLAYDASVVTMQGAVNAGIYRAIPSFFGVSLDNPEIANMPFMKTKLPVLNDVLAKAEKGEITYTGINTGMFLDWVLDEDIFVGLSGKAPTRVADGGDIPMSATALDDIGKAISSVLLRPDETANKLYYVHTVVMTQNQVLGYAREAAPGAEFAVEQVDTKVLVEAAWKRYNEGIRDQVSVRDFVIRASYGMGNGFFPKTDNEFLGIRQWSEEELEEEIFKRVKANPPVSLKIPGN
ncbi:2-hydroxyisoflavone reductase [Fusarium bulbicola]|nr:2-hydroxyisoflavone reductase [Fusarium bulbicola]